MRCQSNSVILAELWHLSCRTVKVGVLVIDCVGQGKTNTGVYKAKLIQKLCNVGRCPEIPEVLKFVLKLELGPEICTYILKFFTRFHNCDQV